MTNKISEIDGEAKARRWLGGEAAVPLPAPASESVSVQSLVVGVGGLRRRVRICRWVIDRAAEPSPHCSTKGVIMRRPLYRWLKVVRECRLAEPHRRDKRVVRLRFHPTGPTPSARMRWEAAHPGRRSRQVSGPGWDSRLPPTWDDH